MENTRLIRSNNTTGFRGISYDKRYDKYYVKIKHKNKSYSIGYFKTKELAALAYNNWVIEHGTNHPLNKINMTT